MAFPDGRLLASRERELYLLSVDGWSRLGLTWPSGATPLTEAEAANWCERQNVAFVPFDPSRHGG
ncbi:MAG: hypothetical protein JOZ47_09555 [Kutzneria sp.]|nr:hypothetical protein [Kutzneria sp.]